MKCWASTVSECCNTQSREHYITKGLFSGKHVEISGAPFLNGEIKKVSKSSLTKKCLCSLHNSLLSPFDDEAIKFAQAMEHANKLTIERQNSNKKTISLHRRYIDAELFTRWAIKTYIGMLSFFPKPSKIDINQLAEMVYGSKKLRKFVDYRVAMESGDEFKVSEIVGIAPLMDSDFSVGLSISIYGIIIQIIFHEAQISTSKLPKIKFTVPNKGASCFIVFK